MLRQASSRNQRSKGFKVKHALQICLLIAICIWLIYQVKHSHEKKRAFEERNSKIFNKVLENPEDFFKLGRKDLPHIEELGSEIETLNKEDDNEETQEEEEEERATKQEEEIEEDEGRGDGEDEIDEQDQEKGGEEAENGEESTEQDKDSHDEVDLFDNQEHEGGSQEAREENYKRDDASSAVVHDTHVTESETSNGDARSMEEEHVVNNADDESNDNGSKQVDDSSTVDSKNDKDSNDDASKHDVDSTANGSKTYDDTNADIFKGEAVSEHLEKKIVESENVTNRTDDDSGGDTVLEDKETLSTENLSSNAMASDKKNIEVDNKDLVIKFSKLDNGSVANSTIVEDNNQLGQKDNSSVVNAYDTAVTNDAVNSYLTQDQNITGDGTTLGEEEHNSLNVESEEHSSTLLHTNENGDAADEKSENLSHAVITEEEKDVRTDLSTLPDIQSELKSTDDEATE